MPKDAIKYHYQPNIHTDGGGLFVIDSVQDYVPIACYMIFPTSSAQRHIEINYNPANGVYYGQTIANLGIEVTTVYLKYIP